MRHAQRRKWRPHTGLSTTEFETALRDNFAGWVQRSERNGKDQSGGSNELQWLVVTVRRPTALTNMEGSARMGGHAATQGEHEKKKKYGNRNQVGPDTVKPISIELGGRQTINALQSLTTKLAEARGEELNAATALRKMRLVVEREQAHVRKSSVGTSTGEHVKEAGGAASRKLGEPV